MDRKRAGNPGRRGYIVETPLPRGRTVNELESLAPGINESRGTGMRNARMNPEDAERKPRRMPELNRRYAPVENTVQRLKRGGTANAASRNSTPKRKSKQTPARTKRY